MHMYEISMPGQSLFVTLTFYSIPKCEPLTLGTLILWFGWYGFNCGSTQGLGENLSNAAAKIGVATTISAATSGTTTILLNFFLDRR